MYLEVTGSPKGDVDLERLKSATHYYIHKLYEFGSVPEVEVELCFCPNTYMSGFDAFCSPLDYDDPNPQIFLIDLNEECTEQELLIAIAHEMVHLRQFNTGQLKFEIGRDYQIWMGRKVKKLEEETYRSSPWEMEAFDLEDKLYEFFLRDFEKSSLQTL